MGNSTGRGTLAVVYLGRALLGRPMDGKRRTNATFFHSSYGPTPDLTAHGRSARWHHLPGWQRAGYRVAGFSVALSFIYGMLTDRTATEACSLAAVAISLVLGSWWAYVAIRDYRINHRVGRPLYETASGITGHNPSEDHKRHLSIPRDYRTNNKATVTLRLPYSWEAHAGEQRRLHDLVKRRLGGDWDMHPHFDAHPPRIEWRPSPAPPSSLNYADIYPVLEKQGSANKIIIGIGTHEMIAGIDLDSEAPHIAISMGTGGGKSSLLRLIVAQLVRHGVEWIGIIDPKRISHNWAKDIPQVHIFRTMAQQMEALKDFRILMENRYEQLEGDETLEFPRHVMLIEEQNSWIAYAEAYWQDYRMELEPNERARVPRRNPAIGDLGFCLFQGRQARMNIISVYQRMSAKASGGGDLRENYGAKILARFSPQTWKLLVGTVPVPRSSKVPGRAKLVLGEDDKWVQMAFITEAEAREYAAKFGGKLADDTSGPDDDSPVTLREAADADVIPMRYAALRRARTRERERFPAAIATTAGQAYKPSDLRAWHESRSRGKLRNRLAA